MEILEKCLEELLKACLKDVWKEYLKKLLKIRLDESQEKPDGTPGVIENPEGIP